MNRRSLDEAPEGVVVLVEDPEEGVCTARMALICGEQFWMPYPASAESGLLRPICWAPCPVFDDVTAG